MSHEMPVEPTDPVTVMARRVKDLRAGKGWTAAELGDALTEQGVRWDRFTVASLENGKRQNISVKEMLALAFVLDVPPAFLLIPNGNEPLRVTQKIALYAPNVLEFMNGAELPPPWMMKDPSAVRRWLTATGLFGLLQKFRRAWTTGSEEETAARLADVVNEMVEKDVYPPPMPASAVKQMEARGFRYTDRIQIAAESDDGAR